MPWPIDIPTVLRRVRFRSHGTVCPCNATVRCFLVEFFSLSEPEDGLGFSEVEVVDSEKPKGSKNCSSNVINGLSLVDED